jgi:hypothetical protein
MIIGVRNSAGKSCPQSEEGIRPPIPDGQKEKPAWSDRSRDLAQDRLVILNVRERSETNSPVKRMTFEWESRRVSSNRSAPLWVDVEAYGI